jgi:ABC-type sugar transport system permease subunit
LAIPDIIKGIQCNGTLVDDGNGNMVPDYYVYKDAFNVATLTEASAVVTIFVYSLVLASVLTMSGSRNKLKLKL